MVSKDAAQAIEFATQLLVLGASGLKNLHLLVGSLTLIHQVRDPFPDPVMIGHLKATAESTPVTTPARGT